MKGSLLTGSIYTKGAERDQHIPPSDQETGIITPSIT